MKQSIRTFIIFILISLTVGVLSSIVSGGTKLYSAISQPALSPPGYIFPIVWTILYILMGISSYIIYTSGSPSTTDALSVYTLQLFFNFFWSILFFKFSLFFPSFVWLLLLIFLIIIMILKFYSINPIAAYLQIPYLLWCLFAAYLNLMIYILN